MDYMALINDPRYVDKMVNNRLIPPDSDRLSVPNLPPPPSVQQAPQQAPAPPPQPATEEAQSAPNSIANGGVGGVPLPDGGSPNLPPKSDESWGVHHGIMRGLYGLNTSSRAVVAVAQEIFGIDNSEQLKKIAEISAEKERKFPAHLQSIMDAQNPIDFLKWTSDIIGESIPFMVPVGGAYVAGAKLAGKLGGAAAAFGTSAGLQTGQTAEEQIGAKGEVSPAPAIAAGAAKGAVEMLVPSLVATGAAQRLGIGEDILMPFGEKVLKKLSVPQLIGVGATGEALTEGIQESIDLAAREYIDEGYLEGHPEEVKDRLINAVAGGAIGGAVFGPLMSPIVETERRVDDKIERLEEDKFEELYSIDPFDEKTEEDIFTQSVEKINKFYVNQVEAANKDYGGKAPPTVLAKIENNRQVAISGLEWNYGRKSGMEGNLEGIIEADKEHLRTFATKYGMKTWLMEKDSRYKRRLRAMMERFDEEIAQAQKEQVTTQGSVRDTNFRVPDSPKLRKLKQGRVLAQKMLKKGFDEMEAEIRASQPELAKVGTRKQKEEVPVWQRLFKNRKVVFGKKKGGWNLFDKPEIIRSRPGYNALKQLGELGKKLLAQQKNAELDVSPKFDEKGNIVKIDIGKDVEETNALSIAQMGQLYRLRKDKARNMLPPRLEKRLNWLERQNIPRVLTISENKKIKKKARKTVQLIEGMLNDMHKELGLTRPLTISYEDLSGSRGAYVGTTDTLFPALIKLNINRINKIADSKLAPAFRERLMNQMIYTAIHEFGHFVTLEYFREAPSEIQNAVFEAFEKHLASKGIKLDQEYLQNFASPIRAAMLARMEFEPTFPPNYKKNYQTYAEHFTEWFAEQYAKAAIRPNGSLTSVQKWIKDFYDKLISYLRHVIENISHKPKTAEERQRARDLAKADFDFSPTQAIEDYIAWLKTGKDRQVGRESTILPSELRNLGLSESATKVGYGDREYKDVDPVDPDYPDPKADGVYMLDAIQYWKVIRDLISSDKATSSSIISTARSIYTPFPEDVYHADQSPENSEAIANLFNMVIGENEQETRYRTEQIAEAAMTGTRRLKDFRDSDSVFAGGLIADIKQDQAYFVRHFNLRKSTDDKLRRGVEHLVKLLRAGVPPVRIQKMFESLGITDLSDIYSVSPDILTKRYAFEMYKVINEYVIKTPEGLENTKYILQNTKITDALMSVDVHSTKQIKLLGIMSYVYYTGDLDGAYKYAEKLIKNRSPGDDAFTLHLIDEEISRNLLDDVNVKLIQEEGRRFLAETGQEVMKVQSPEERARVKNLIEENKLKDGLIEVGGKAGPYTMDHKNIQAAILNDMTDKAPFPQSRVRDVNGNLLLLYHGSHIEPPFLKFAYGKFTYFATSSPGLATSYTQIGHQFDATDVDTDSRPNKMEGWGPRIHPVVMDMRNPYVYEAAGATWHSLKYPAEARFISERHNPNVLRGDMITTNKMAEMAKEAGYDGLIIKDVIDVGNWAVGTNLDDTPKDVYIVWNPDQIRHVKGATEAGTTENALFYEKSPMTNGLGKLGKEIGDEEGVRRLTVPVDRWNWFMKIFLNIKQWSLENPHIASLSRYVEGVNRWSNEQSNWLAVAEKTIKKWNKLPGDQQDRLNGMIFWVIEQKFLNPKGPDTPTRELEFVPRHPTAEELAKMKEKFKLSDASMEIYFQIQKDFQQVLEKIHLMTLNEIHRTYASNPKREQQKIAEANAEFEELKKSPYFPRMRFGKYAVVVTGESGSALRIEHFQSKREAYKAAEKSKKLRPKATVTVRKVSRAIQTFEGLPLTTLKAVRRNMEHILSDDQLQWLDDYINEMSIVLGARERMGVTKHIPGYSRDAMRSYATYFFRNSKHFARLEYGFELEAAIVELTNLTMGEPVPGEDDRMIKDRVAISGIRDAVVQHYDYIMHPKEDWASLRGMAFVWHIGWVPSAAAINFTQVPLVAAPYLEGIFGTGRALPVLTREITRFRNWYHKGDTSNLDADYVKALNQAVDESIVDESMAAHLASIASGGMLRLAGRNKAKRGLTMLLQSSSFMFSHVEKSNRRIVFSSAYRMTEDFLKAFDPDMLDAEGVTLTRGGIVEYLQMVADTGKIEDFADKEAFNTYLKNFTSVGDAQKVADYLYGLYLANKKHYGDLKAIHGFSEDKALAYIAAKDAVERTQFLYAEHMRPEFMQGKKGVLFAFYMFLQNSLYFAFGKNVKGAQMRYWMYMLAAAGLMGLPGAEDLSELARMMARKLGINFDIKKELRELVQEFLDDDFDADFLLHGASRQTFFLPYLAGLAGIPMPTMDMSQNLSMGRVVPGLELLTSSGDAADRIARGTEDIAGATYSIAFNFMKALTDVNHSIDDFKRWERAMPRAARQFSQMMRYRTEGRERTNTGATMVEFDLDNPEQSLETFLIGLGFKSERLSDHWDRNNMIRESEKYHLSKRQLVLKRLDQAIFFGNDEERKQAFDDLHEFNKNLPDDYKTLSITGKTLQTSLKQREKKRALYEAGLPGSGRMSIPGAQAINKLFPEQETLNRSQ